jgi:CheY-like chemotaxis protein
MDYHPSIFKNIWFVDDDEDDHLVFETAIKNVLPSAKLTHLYRCDEFLSFLDHTVPDLVFLDMELPHMNGKTCLKHIREKRELDHLPIIVYSGSARPLDINASYGYGATLYLIKPLTSHTLEMLLKSIFNLNWDDPKAITDKQFVGGRFVPFSTE